MRNKQKRHPSRRARDEVARALRMTPEFVARYETAHYASAFALRASADSKPAVARVASEGGSLLRPTNHHPPRPGVPAGPHLPAIGQTQSVPAALASD